MKDISESNEAIKQQMVHSQQEMTEIVGVISEIGSKTKVIHDIVFQTKLLSFNASVEAARAGEQGKGFSVVAEEIGSLARMSGSAAAEITQLLESSTKKVQQMVQSTQSGVEALMQSGEQRVKTGITVANECSQVLREIVANTTGVSKMAAEISSASQEQAQGISEINRAVNQMEQSTQKNVVTTEQITQVTEDLSEIARALQQSVHILTTTLRGRSVDSPLVQEEGNDVIVSAQISKSPSLRRNDFKKAS